MHKVHFFFIFHTEILQNFFTLQLFNALIAQITLIEYYYNSI